MVDWDIIKPCLYNFIGYGNLSGSVWFIGVEEGGAEVWRNETLTLEESLRLRAHYDLAMDFRHVWEDLYGISLDSWKGATTWRYMAAFLLALQGTKPDTDAVRRYLFQDNQLGRLDGDHFLCEFMPLPKSSKWRIEPYGDVWATVREYRQAVAPCRRRLILETIQKHPSVRLLVSYERDMEDLFLRDLDAERVKEWTLFTRQRYTLWQFRLASTRILHMVQTPFFGQGKISYEGIWQSTQRLPPAGS